MYSILSSICTECNISPCSCNNTTLSTYSSTDSYQQILTDITKHSANRENVTMTPYTESIKRSSVYNISENSPHPNINVNISRDTSNNTARGSLNDVLKDTNESGNYDLSYFGLVKGGLRIGNLNVCHLLPKLDEIRLILHESRSVNILGLCETFLNDHVDDNVLSIDGFNFERRDRDGGSGGGILVYVSNQISYKRRTDLEIGGPETIWLEIMYPNTKSILVCSGYRPPPPSAHNSWVDGLVNEIRKATSCVDTEVLLFGDFNINYAIEPPQFWINALEEFDMAQMITTPTRVTAKSSTLIDHVYTNKPENICEINVPIIALSDHYPVCVTRRFQQPVKKNKHIEIMYRDFKNIDENELFIDLLDVNFDVIEQICDPNEILCQFYSLLFRTVDKHAKTKTKRVKTQFKPSWITPEIREARHKRDFFHKKKDDENFKYWHNKVTGLIRAAKEQYYKSAIDNHKTLKTYGDI